MSSLSTVEQTQIDLSVGGVVVSNYLSYLTMGIVLSATWTYFSKFPTDRWWFKALVILCVSMCIGDTIATGIWSYDWAVTNYANPAALAFIHWASPVNGFLLATCALTVQLFYASRLWIMSMKNNWILPVVIACLSILGWCIACWMAHTITTHKLISDLALLIPVVYIWLGGSVGADVLITSSMIYYLDLSFRRKTQKNRLPGRFRKLLMRIVECNLLSLLAQAITIALFNRSSVGLYFVITDMMLTKVYTFSLLVALNCRHSENGPGSGEGGFSSSRKEGGIVELTVLHTSSYPSTQVSHIQRETTTTGDNQEQTKRPASRFNNDEFDTDVVLSPVV
ncbi:hypothetical protein BT96DRAFT_979855 [Gymnopus androsaceus JB14]|uniref:DUF6534 domain-containing protein n=1 Tax=Gymnopus androsaceus JB14 TaxID=1447944 RepID=A0A6A4GZM0_9AGAR|nr:hypothetical protein BT96DRAFT_979855 [Gymnopus androsaceus JB14]